MQRAAAYIRVSTEEQTEFSPDAQLFAIRQYAGRSKMLLDESFIFRDEGISGRRADKRPGFMSMIQTAKTKPKPFDVILVHKFDRFARSREDSIIFKSLLRKECGIKVVSISEPMEDDKMSVIMEAMIEAMAEYYSLNLSEEVKKGMTEKARRGELQTPAPFGYRMIDGLLTPNEQEAEIVREIFHKYVNENMSLRRIAQYVNFLGVRTIRGNPFEKRSIEYIIYNPTYIGKMRWTPTASVINKHDFDNPDTMIKDGRHEAIVDEKLFEAANRKIRIHTIRRNRYQRSSEITTHWLQGVLRCGECFSTLSYGKAYGNRKSAYRCNRYLNGGCKHSQRLTIDKAEEAVLEVLSKDSLKFEQKEFERIIQKTDNNNLQSEQIKRQLDKVDAKLEKAKELVLSGIDTAEEYQKNKEELNCNKSLLLEKLNSLCVEEKDDVQIFRDKIGSIYDILISDKASLMEKNQAIKEIVKYITYDKKQDTLNLYYYYLI